MTDAVMIDMFDNEQLLFLHVYLLITLYSFHYLSLVKLLKNSGTTVLKNAI